MGSGGTVAGCLNLGSIRKVFMLMTSRFSSVKRAPAEFKNRTIRYQDKTVVLCMIPGFRRCVNETVALLAYYAAYNGGYLSKLN
jgi:hypothetical protein